MITVTTVKIGQMAECIEQLEATTSGIIFDISALQPHLTIAGFERLSLPVLTSQATQLAKLKSHVKTTHSSGYHVINGKFIKFRGDQ